jgi:hypothetical protein
VGYFEGSDYARIALITNGSCLRSFHAYPFLDWRLNWNLPIPHHNADFENDDTVNILVVDPMTGAGNAWLFWSMRMTMIHMIIYHSDSKSCAKMYHKNGFRFKSTRWECGEFLKKAIWGTYKHLAAHRLCSSFVTYKYVDLRKPESTKNTQNVRRIESRADYDHPNYYLLNVFLIASCGIQAWYTNSDFSKSSVIHAKTSDTKASFLKSLLALLWPFSK